MPEPKSVVSTASGHTSHTSSDPSSGQPLASRSGGDGGGDTSAAASAAAAYAAAPPGSSVVVNVAVNLLAATPVAAAMSAMSALPAVASTATAVGLASPVSIVTP